MRKIAYALVLLGWVTVFAHVWRDVDSTQWDFKAYYAAVVTDERGLNPYVVHDIRAVAGERHLLPFYYPRLALYVLKPFVGLNYESAHRLWLVLKFLAMVGLLLVWKRSFLRATSWLLLLVVGLLGFQAATLWDLRSGNIATFEELLLWSGLAFLVRSRVTAFVACVVVAGLFKLLPAVFLLLLLLPCIRSRLNSAKLAAGVLILLLLIFVPFVGHRDQLTAFCHAIAAAHPRLEYSPSILGVADELGVYLPAFKAAWLKYTVVAAYYAALLFVSRRVLLRAYDCASPRGPILIAAMFYAVLAPRFVIYSYMIAFVPLLALVVPAVREMKFERHAVVAAVSIGGLRVFPTKAGEFLDAAAPLLLLLGCWWVVVAFERRGGLDTLLGKRIKR